MGDGGKEERSKELTWAFVPEERNRGKDIAVQNRRRDMRTVLRGKKAKAEERVGNKDTTDPLVS